MTLTCCLCGAVFRRHTRSIVIDPKTERIRHAIKRECRLAKQIEDLWRRGYKLE